MVGDLGPRLLLDVAVGLNNMPMTLSSTTTKAVRPFFSPGNLYSFVTRTVTPTINPCFCVGVGLIV